MRCIFYPRYRVAWWHTAAVPKCNLKLTLILTGFTFDAVQDCPKVDIKASS